MSDLLCGKKVVVEPEILIGDGSPFCADEVEYMFEPQDRWLAEFIFNNFGKAGNAAMERLYVRLTKMRVELK